MTLQSYTVVDVALGTPDPPGLDRSVRMYVADEVDALILTLQGEKLGAENKLRAMAALVDGRQVEPTAAMYARITALTESLEYSRQFFVLIRPHTDAALQRMIDDALAIIANPQPGHPTALPAVNHKFEGCP